MKDELKKVKKMEDDLKKMKMDEDLNIFVKNQNDDLKEKGRRLFKKIEDDLKNQMEDDLKNKIWKTT